MTDQDDPTTDELRAALAPTVASNAAFDGWGEEALHMAAEGAGIDPEVARLAFPGGPVDMIDAWFAWVDRTMAERWQPEALARLKVRERIRVLVEARLEAVAPDREALRRALAVLALRPLTATRLAWRAADTMWRLAGDTATDLNHYSKRATLVAVYGTTATVFLDDESDGFIQTRAFLGRRLEEVMRLEKAKAAAAKRSIYRPSLSRFVGRLRYPVA